MSSASSHPRAPDLTRGCHDPWGRILMERSGFSRTTPDDDAGVPRGSETHHWFSFRFGSGAPDRSMFPLNGCNGVGGTVRG